MASALVRGRTLKPGAAESAKKSIGIKKKVLTEKKSQGKASRRELQELRGMK